MSAVYRLTQGFRALGSWLRPANDALAADILPPALYALYRQMRRSERQHSLRVYHDLQAGGFTAPEVLIAALLHDVGKSRYPFTLPEKVLVVLVKAVAPHLYRQWGSGSVQGWRGPFAVSAQHPAWGADMVAGAGGSPPVVDLIRRHADLLPAPPGETDRLLAALQTADDRN